MRMCIFLKNGKLLVSFLQFYNIGTILSQNTMTLTKYVGYVGH